ncbi:hypothetical protein B4N89_13635 [Embleya scabrispora]|uniref:Helix-turn-helix domain-containing protein n=1 Tax=Embleya scabrispora TaxID=159449 RepID=A0A1T3NYD0_9ACTN|nr:helix-turn-helix domain-containing protein [Embleya scabrispora]OPC81839.1 hypothetical protein B4N89_13635 [Embleya scabrispora]
MNRQTVIPNRLLHPVEEAAELLGIGRTAVYGLIKSQALDSTMLAGRRLIPYTSLVDYVASLLSAERTDLEQSAGLDSA